MDHERPSAQRVNYTPAMVRHTCDLSLGQPKARDVRAHFASLTAADGTVHLGFWTDVAELTHWHHFTRGIPATACP